MFLAGGAELWILLTVIPLRGFTSTSRYLTPLWSAAFLCSMAEAGSVKGFNIFLEAPSQQTTYQRRSYP